MSKVFCKRKAGSTIRSLARSRRTVAMASFGGAAFLFALLPFLWVSLGRGYVSLAATVVAVNVIVWLICFGFIYRGKAARAVRGALGEEQLAVTLDPLIRSGWTVEYNLPLRWGDADVFLLSPSGKYYVIDAKSQGGTVFFDSQLQLLMRRYATTVCDLGLDRYGKPKDLLKSVKGQAFELARSKNIAWVTPIVCFTRASFDATIPTGQPLQGAYVVALDRVLDLLDRLESDTTCYSIARSPELGERTSQNITSFPSPPTAENGWIDTRDSNNPELLLRARNIIDTNIYCVLGTATPDGWPWVSPVFFARDSDYNFYWCSAVASEHSQNLYVNQGRVSIVIFDSSAPSGTGKGVYFRGTAAEQTDPEIINRAFKLLISRAGLKLERLPSDYLDISPRRIYRFQPTVTWVSGDRVPASNHQLVDTKIPIQLN